MDENTRAFARNMFRLKVHEANGQAYEDLFVRIMPHARKGFRPVKPCGNLGDRSNDGFDSKTGTYFQVYAPEDIKKTPKQALAKLKANFKGLKAFWHGFHEVKEFYFAVNDKYDGVSPSLETEMASIKKRHKLAEAEVFLAKDLEEVLFGLPGDVIIAVVGHVPAIDAGQFLMLSGYSYFIGAWIDFERTGRKLVEQGSRRLAPGRQIIEVLERSNVIDDKTQVFLINLNQARNMFVHGDSLDLPPKQSIDDLVALTERLKKLKPLKPEDIPDVWRK